MSLVVAKECNIEKMLIHPHLRTMGHALSQKDIPLNPSCYPHVGKQPLESSKIGFGTFAIVSFRSGPEYTQASLSFGAKMRASHARSNFSRLQSRPSVHLGDSTLPLAHIRSVALVYTCTCDSKSHRQLGKS